MREDEEAIALCLCYCVLVCVENVKKEKNTVFINIGCDNYFNFISSIAIFY